MNTEPLNKAADRFPLRQLGVSRVPLTPLPCDEVEKLLPRFIDRDPALGETTQAITDHILACPACSEKLRAARQKSAA